MPDTDSLSSRFRAEVFSLSSVVILTASVFALVAGYVIQGWVGDTGAGIGAVMSIGIGVPSLYDEWPAQYTSAVKTCLWTAVESILAFCLYVLVFTLVGAGFSTVVATVLAILVTTSLPIGIQFHRAWIA